MRKIPHTNFQVLYKTLKSFYNNKLTNAFNI